MKVCFLRPSYFIWALVYLALYAALQMIGLPHILWSYDLPRRCTYIGWSGAVSVYFPSGGRCSWIVFAKKDRRAGQ